MTFNLCFMHVTQFTLFTIVVCHPCVVFGLSVTCSVRLVLLVGVDME